jgi:hypothetical protein
MNHVTKFKATYIHALVAIAAALSTQLTPLKDYTRAQLAQVTWIGWWLIWLAVLVILGNTLIASWPKSAEDADDTPPIPAPAPASQPAAPAPAAPDISVQK